jgi:hypothetical protein
MIYEKIGQKRQKKIVGDTLIPTVIDKTPT